MFTKRILNDKRLRHIPRSFSWIDRRFIQDGHILGCAKDELLLYLFLTMVGDRYGISFYGDVRINGLLKIKQEALDMARKGLIEKGLIEYQKPLYQVLELGQCVL